MSQKRHGRFSSPGRLNIFSMRSVMRKPLTMLVMEAASAIAPRSVITGGWSWPVITIEATTAIAEIALVSDMSGVCSRRETRVTTPSPMKVASRKTKSREAKAGDVGRAGLRARGGEERLEEHRVVLPCRPAGGGPPGDRGF